VIAAFVLAPKNEVNPGGEGLESFDGRVHVGRFRIVVVVDSTHRGDILQTMLDRLEPGGRFPNLSRIDASQHSDTDSRQHVLDVVRTFQRNLADWHDLALAFFIAPDNALPTCERSP